MSDNPSFQQSDLLDIINEIDELRFLIEFFWDSVELYIKAEKMPPGCVHFEPKLT